MKSIERKAFRFEVKDISEAGEFKGYASTRKRDSYGDIVAEGAFAKTIRDNEGRFPVLWFHDPKTPIGISTHMEEDGHGLYVEGQLDLDTEAGRNVYSGMKKGYIDRFSIGYRTIQDEYDPECDARILKEVALLEFSPVTKNFAANDEALLTGVKAQDETVEILRGILDEIRALRDAAGPSEDTRHGAEPPSGADADPEIRALADELLLSMKGEL